MVSEPVGSSLTAVMEVERVRAAAEKGVSPPLAATSMASPLVVVVFWK